MADDFRPGDEDRIADPSNPVKERYSRRGRRIMTALVAVAAVLGFGVVLVYAYNKGKQDGGTGTAPVIQAQEGLTKTRPESPGGMNVPDRDKEIFNRLETGQQADKVERLLPPPEKPMDRPPAPPAAMPASPEPAGGGTNTMAKAAPDAMPAAPSSSSMPLNVPPPPPPAAIQVPAPPPEAKAPAPKAPVAKAPEPKKVAPTKPAKVAAKKPAAKPAVAGKWKIQLSSLRSDAAARKTWAGVQSKNKDLLGKLSLSVQRVALSGGKGTYYRVQAGPLASRSAAGALCTRLKARKLSCIVVRP